MRWSMVLVFAGLLTGCTRPILMPTPARPPLLTAKEYRLGVIDFGKAAPSDTHPSDRVGPTVTGPSRIFTHLARELNPVPAAEPPRYTFFDHGTLRAGGPLNEQNAYKAHQLDAYLTGTVRTGDHCHDLRLVNAVSHAIISSYAGYCEGEESTVAGRLIIDPLKNPGVAVVSSVKGTVIVINRGYDKLKAMRSGMMARLVAGGDTLLAIASRADRAQPQTPEAMIASSGRQRELVRQRVRAFTGVDPAQVPVRSKLRRGEIGEIVEEVVGEIYIASVEREYSIGILFQGDYALPGDLVVFK